MSKARDLSQVVNPTGAEKVGYQVPGGVVRDVAGKLREVVSVLDFIPQSEHAAIRAGNSNYDCTSAIQTAINAATKVFFPHGTYRVVAATYDATTDWRHHIIVPANRTLEFHDAIIVTNTAFAARAVLFLIRGSNVTIKGIKTRDDNVVSNNWIIPVGSGSTYDSSFPIDTLTDLVVDSGHFVNAWLAVTVQFSSSDGGNKFFERVRVSNCESIARIGVSSAGNFSFRSDGPWKVRDVVVSDCVARNGRTASSYNFYGVDGFSLSNCVSYNNAYAGTEMENGTQDGVITNFRSVDDIWGVWIDDSRRITVIGVSHKTVSETYVSPLFGTLSRLRDAVRITREGFPNYTTWVTEGIVVQGVVSEFGRIFVGTSGDIPSGSFGRISFSGVQLIADGVSRSSGNTIVQVGGSCPDFLLSDAYVFGAPSRAIELSVPSDGKHKLTNVKTATAAGESSTGLFSIGPGRLSLLDVNVHSDNNLVSVLDVIDYRVGGTLRPNRFQAQQFLYGQSGSPEGVVTAGPGSVFHRSDAGLIHVKLGDISNTGWRIVSLYLQTNVFYDPPSLSTGTSVTTTVTVTGAALGNHVSVSFASPLQGIELRAWVSADDTVSVRFQNDTGSTIDLAAEVLSVRVFS